MREIGARSHEATVLSNLGSTYQALGQHARAITFYNQALAIKQEVGARADEAATLYKLMTVQRYPRLAIFYGKQAVNIFQAIRGNIQTLDQTLQRSFLTSKEDVYRTLAELLLTEGRLPEAQQVLDLLKEEEYFDFVRRDAQKVGTLQKRATLTPEEEQQTAGYRARTDLITALGQEKGALLATAKKTPLTVTEVQRLEEIETDLVIAAQAFQQFLDDLKTAFKTDPERQSTLTELSKARALQQTLADLGPGTVALYTVVTPGAYHVILTTPAVQVARTKTISATALACKILAFRQALRSPRMNPQPLAHELYQLLIDPIAQDLAGAGAQTLMLALDGVLRYLPFSALHDGERYLVERYRTVVFTPASKDRLKDVPSPAWKGLGLGVSQAHGDFKALPAVARELRGIIRDDDAQNQDGILPGVIKLDAAFTAQTMFAALYQQYPMVHIASHFAFHPGNETQSFLLLGDGTRLPLAQLNERENVFGGVELLTLSACDTAIGGKGANGKEVEGFGVMAQELGAKAVIATLWPVEDESTKDLMQILYRERETIHGLPKVEALRRAQLALLHGKGQPDPGLQGAALGTEPPRLAVVPDPNATPAREGHRGLRPLEGEGCDTGATQLPFTPNPQAPYAHPYYWAPFILIGNWK